MPPPVWHAAPMAVWVHHRKGTATHSWAFVPQASLTWKHEFENDPRDIAVSFVGDTRGTRFSYQTEAPDRDWGEINVGVGAVSPRGIQLFGNFRTLAGSKYFDSRAVTIGLRLSF